MRPLVVIISVLFCSLAVEGFLSTFAPCRKGFGVKIPLASSNDVQPAIQAPVQEVLPPYKATTNVTLKFPSYAKLMNCRVGQYVTSESFSCGSQNATFCVKLYPRGGGHRPATTTTTVTGKETEQGFGMAYQVLPMFPDSANDIRNQKVGMYLQYLGCKGDDNSDPNQKVDATFALRLQGNQKEGRKYDVEWRAGMRFVPTSGKTELSKGCANDFGAHLMQTALLQDFMGWESGDQAPLIANVQVILHHTEEEIKAISSLVPSNDDPDEEEDEQDKPQSFFAAIGNDIRIPPDATSKDLQHDGRRVRVGKVVVPILSKLGQRPKMFAQGAYPGVEYRILRILDSNGNERFTSCPGCEYELKPIYPLVAQLERPWPVRIPESDIPRLYTPNMYNAVSAVGSLLTAITGLVTAFLVSQAISFFFIPSRSMDPTLQVGDVLLVDKVSPRLLKHQKPGDIVLFSPPDELNAIVAASGGKITSRDLFVKRVAAKSGDRVQVDAQGKVRINGEPAWGRRDLCEAEPLRLIEKYVKPKDIVLGKDEAFVMGDCSSVSIDSRQVGLKRYCTVVHPRHYVYMNYFSRKGSMDAEFGAHCVRMKLSASRC